MKSISEIASGMSLQVRQAQTMALPGRPAPLEPSEIEAIDQALQRHYKITKSPVYGYKTTRDADGEITGSEYDVVGQSDSYELITPPPERLRDAIMRPASTRHVVAHLTRLAAHRRDTRGAAALSVALEEIAIDLGSVSEWAVVTACREMRGKPGWYPQTTEIMDTIRAEDAKFKALFTRQPARIEAQKPAEKPKSWKDLPKPRWAADQWAAYCADALGMAEQARRYPAALDPEFWINETARRRVEASEAGFAQAEAC